MVRLAAIALMAVAGSASGKAPAWLQELAAAPLPPQPPETEAVLLLSEVELVVAPNGQMRKRVRGALRVLRREGERRALLPVTQDSWSRLRDMRGWAIPPAGKDLEVRLKDAIETSVVNVEGSELITDIRMRLLAIPGARPGATVGYEYELSLSGLELADTFGFQDTVPVLRARYSLRLPPGWTMTPTWINHAAVEPASAGERQWHWTLHDLPPVAVEPRMPAWQAVAGQLFLAFAPPGTTPRLSTWQGIGGWFVGLAGDRRVASAQIRGKVGELVAGRYSQLDRLRALATFVQRDIRYVGIQLGIGGFQPHAAHEVFRNRYGDCKDKTVLLAVMLAEAGIESEPVLVHTDRSMVRPAAPASLRFNHVILAIRLPPGLQAPELLATLDEPDGSRLLFFDPTDEVTALGRLRGALQGSHGLLALAEGSRLVQLPQLPREQNGVRRTARLKLDDQGELTGDVVERFLGEHADLQRQFLRSGGRDTDIVRPLEARLADSLASFRIATASIGNEGTSGLPLEWRFSLSAESYARRADDLLMVRPRLMGAIADGLFGEESKRVHDLLLGEPRIDRDELIIELPAGYVVESVPAPVDLDMGFAAYRSRTDIAGSQLSYTRSYELREWQLSAAGIEAYRHLQREIARDERAVVLMKRCDSGCAR